MTFGILKIKLREKICLYSILFLSRIQPELPPLGPSSGWELGSLARYIDAKTIVLGSFYALCSAALATLLDQVSVAKKRPKTSAPYRPLVQPEERDGEA